MKKVLYISSLLPNDEYNFYAEKNMISSYASQKFHRSFVFGLKENDVEVSCLSVCKPIFVPLFNHEKHEILNEFKSNILNVLFLPFLIKKEIKKFVHYNPDAIVIFDSINLFSTTACEKLNRKYKGKFVPIVTDVYGKRTFVTKNFIKKLFEKSHERKLKRFEKIVILTDQMNELYKTNQNLTSVMEGFSINVSESVKNNETKHKVMYAGIIEEVFGLEKLIDAFKILGNDYELSLYGEWRMKKPSDDVLRDLTNVKYFGIVPNEKIIKEEMLSNLLINPRPNNDEFTKYSFPSKTLEYLSTGVPVMCARLAGIPDDYFNYLVELNCGSAETIADCIFDFFKKSTKEREKIGKAGANFVLVNKNPKSQITKVIEDLKLWIK